MSLYSVCVCACVCVSVCVFNFLLLQIRGNYATYLNSTVYDFVFSSYEHVLVLVCTVLFLHVCELVLASIFYLFNYVSASKSLYLKVII
jgi:hypothetical protein